MNRILLLTGVAALVLTGCKEDEKPPVLQDTKVYEGRGNLDIEYNDGEISGKRVTVHPENGMKATFTFDSQVNLGNVSDALKGIPPFAGPGVLPGTPSLVLTLPLGTDGDEYTFSYTGDTEYVTYTLHGEFDNNKLEAEFENVLLKNKSFAGKAWKPMPSDGNPLSDKQPFHIVWDTDIDITLPEIVGMQNLLRTLVNLPLIPAYNNTAEMSPTQVIANGLKSLAMNADGNMPVIYLQTANGAAQFARTPYGTFQYVPLNPTTLRVFANPTDLLSLVLLNNTNRDPNIPANPFGAPSRDGGTLIQQLQQIAAKMLPLVSKGIPMTCVRQDNTMQLYLDSEFLLPILQQMVIPILKDPAMRGIVRDYVDNNAALSKYSVMIMTAYDALPLILSGTTRLELGLNFVSE